MQQHIVGIRFIKLGKIYHFDASSYPELKLGDHAVVTTKRGKQLGQVVTIVENPGSPRGGSYRRVDRMATPRDLVLRQTWQQKELEATINCRAKAASMKLGFVKYVASEFSFDGETLTILYNYEGQEQVNFTPLRNALRKSYPKTKVEMRQIGPRDVAKILGGLGACGLESRCCSQFLTEFSPISIKMAKAQGISLNPSEITGMCGRLKCCLIYEYEQYVEARKTLPKRNKRVVTPKGEGKVIDLLPLKDAVIVFIPDVGRFEFMRHEIEPWDEREALRRKAEAPCDKHQNGGCNCGKQNDQGE